MSWSDSVASKRFKFDENLICTDTFSLSDSFFSSEFVFDTTHGLGIATDDVILPFCVCV